MGQPRNWGRYTIPLVGAWFLFAAWWFFFRQGMTLAGVMFTVAGILVLVQRFRPRR